MKVIAVLLGFMGSVCCMRVGGYRKLDVSSIPSTVLETAQAKLAEVATQNYAEKSDMGMFKSHIIKAEGQLVSGMNYKFTVQLRSRDGGIEECEFLIYYVVWTGKMQVTTSKCTNPKIAESLDCRGDEIQRVLPHAVSKVNMGTNSLFHMTPVEISNCLKKMKTYSMNVDFKQSTCTNDESHAKSTLSECPESKEATHTDHYHCKVVVGTDTSAQCTLIKDKPKKPLLGGDGHDLCHKGMFKEFQKKHQKYYSTEQEEYKRYEIFCRNMILAKKIQDTEKGTARYGATKFADLREEEFKKYVGKKWNKIQNVNKYMKKAYIVKKDIPESFDWREHNAVTEVKNQGSCGSCWAFSTTGNIEGQWAIKKKNLISLSEQELVSCDKVDQGCEGGLPSNAYKEIERLGGLETEAKYKYDGVDEKCTFNKSDARVYINDSISISQNETEMAIWLFDNGPISIGINAFVMQFYMGGISHPWSFLCNPKELDHGVLIVGYGVEKGKPYWIVKNSWGPDWGEKGYYLVYRGAGVCGLNTMCTSAIVK